MAKNKKAPKWKRLTISTDGRVITIRHNDMDMKALSDFLYAMLKEIPNAPIVMQLVLDKYLQDHEI